MTNTPNRGLNLKGFPVEEGIYLVMGAYGYRQLKEINVRAHEHMGLCCDGRDYSIVKDASHQSNDLVIYNENTDFMVNVGLTGLTFLLKVKDIPQ